jgi:branched-chain amino acid transport system substrate-binding protein
MKRTFLSLAVSAILLITFACRKGGNETAPDTGNIRIGVYADLSGQNSGQSTRNGIELARDEINQAGGISGRQLEVIVEDDKGVPDQAIAAVDKLIAQNKVHALIGGPTVANNLAAAPKAQAARVPMITLSATDPRITQQGDYVFRVAFLDSFQGTEMGRYAANNLKAKTAAILSEWDSQYSNDLAQSFEAEFSKLGGQIASKQSYAAGTRSFKTELTGISPGNPDVIYIPGHHPDVAVIAKEVKELGIKAVLLGGDGWNDPRVLALGDKSLDGAYITSHYSADDPTQAARAFSSTYRKRYGSAPDQVAALAYDATKLLADALTRAGGTDATKVRDALAQTARFSGLTGIITFDADRNASKPAVIFKLQERKIFPVYREEAEPQSR